MGFPRSVASLASLPLWTFLFPRLGSPVRAAIIRHRLRLMTSLAGVRAYIERGIGRLVDRVLFRLVGEQRAGEEEDGTANDASRDFLRLAHGVPSGSWDFTSGSRSIVEI